MQKFLVNSACLLVVCFCAPQAVAESLPAVVDFDLGTPVGIVGSKETTGWSFTVNSPIQVTALGFFDMEFDGLGDPHLVGIWNENEELLAWAEIGGVQSQPLVGSYRYSSIQPLFLTTGQMYVIGATLSPRDPFGIPMEGAPGADPYPHVVPGSVLIDPRISLICPSRIFRGEGGDYFAMPSEFFNFPGEIIGDITDEAYLLAPNFLFVPEPFTFTLLAIGAASLLGHKRRFR